MAISEHRRHQLYQKLEELLGADQAGVLMEHLPPSGWSDVATRADLEHLASLTRAELQHSTLQLGGRIEAVQMTISEQLGRELGAVYRELAAHTRTITFACLGAVMTSAGLAFAAARL